MEEDMREALGDIKKTMDRNSDETRRSIATVHEKINGHASDLNRRIAEHSEASAIARIKLEGRVERAEVDVHQVGDDCRKTTAELATQHSRHIDWHDKERHRGRGIWIAVLLAIAGFLGNLIVKLWEMLSNSS